MSMQSIETSLYISLTSKIKYKSRWWSGKGLVGSIIGPTSGLINESAHESTNKDSLAFYSSSSRYCSIPPVRRRACRERLMRDWPTIGHSSRHILNRGIKWWWITITKFIFLKKEQQVCDHRMKKIKASTCTVPVGLAPVVLPKFLSAFQSNLIML
jgi:hypothetical protein